MAELPAHRRLDQPQLGRRRFDLDTESFARLSERVARHPKARIRRRLVDRIRASVAEAGGVWARLAAFPFPYRSAFNLRVDLDEPSPEDYARFARARRPIDDCSTACS